MTQQNYQEQVEVVAAKQQPEKNSFGNYTLMNKKKMCQLQNKVYFFEGQVDPLHAENAVLKEQLVSHHRIISLSTELLRGLLPIANQNSAKKLKLQMANLEEICAIIKIDWWEMTQQIINQNILNQELVSKLKELKILFEKTVIQYDEQMFNLKQEKQAIIMNYQNIIAELKKNIEEIKLKNEQEKQKMKEEFQSRIERADKIFRELQIYKQETYQKNYDYQKCISRLKGEIQSNLIQFEEGKKVLRSIYDKLMEDKLKDQAETFQIVLKMKEQEKNNIIRQMCEKEQDFKKILSLRMSDITRLNQQKSRFQEQISQNRDEIWKNKLKIDEITKENKENQLKVSLLEENQLILNNKINFQEQTIKNQKEKYTKTVDQYQKSISQLKDQSHSNLNRIINEKNQLAKGLEEKELKLRQTLIALRKSQEVFEKRLEKIKEEWLEKQNLLKQEVQLSLTKLEESQKIINEKDELITKNKQDHEKQLKEVRHLNAVEKQNIIQSHKEKLKELEDINLNELDNLKKTHSRAISEVTVKANEEMRQIMIETNKRIIQYEKKFIIEKQEMQKLIDLEKKQTEKVKNQLSKSQEIIRKQEEEVEMIKIQNIKKLKKIEEEKEQEMKKLNAEIIKQMMDFQKQMQEKEALYEKTMNNMKQQMQKQIKMLKDSNAIENIENKFLGEISKLKEEFANKWKQSQEQRKEQLIKLIEANQNNTNNLTKTFEEDLMRIARKVQMNSTTKMNEDLLSGNNESNQLIKKMNRQQKNAHIENKIKVLKSSINQKDQKIVDLELILSQKNKEIQAMEKTIDERVKQKKQELEKQKENALRECRNKIDKNISECRTKVMETERERLMHSQNLYAEFSLLKEQHWKEYNTLGQKYNELEKLFEERPSRAEDLTKIKQLMGIQNKMDMEIQTYHKKMETANEIVKYLNLELENYKDSYDMFGPDSGQAKLFIAGGAFNGNKNNQNNMVNQSQYHSTNSFNNNNIVNHGESGSIYSIIKNHKNEQKQKEKQKQKQKYKHEDESLHELKAFRKYTDSPQIRELKIFGDMQKSESYVNYQMESPQKQKRQRRYSLLRQPEKRQKQKQKQKQKQRRKTDNEEEIMMNAENFIKFMNNSRLPQIREQPQINGEVYVNRRKSYRKRKYTKKLNTMGVEGGIY